MVHKMSTWWGLVILMGCGILHSLQSTCNDRLNIVCAPIGGRVIVPCPNSSADQVKFRLYKDGENIHHHMCNREINTSNNYPSTNAVGVEYKGAENNFSFTLTEVNASSHGIYRCEAISTFPPPLKELPSTPGIILLIEGHQCNNGMNKNPEFSQTSGFGWLWILTLMVTSYSIAVSIGAIIIWVKWRKEHSQSAYVNTNPTTRGNKRRLHNPKPRFFYAPA